MSFTNYLHKLVFPLIILLLAYLPLAGQTPYVFRHLKVENGLSNNNVKTILKDCEGFLWIGTANGLNRYDGYSFKVYQPKEKDIHSLLSNDIWNLQEDGLGNLWIGSEARYCIYDRDKDNFITDIPSYLLKIGIQINGTYKVHVDKRHNLWVLQGQNAFYFNFSHKTLKTFKIDNFPEETPELSISDDGENLYLLWNSTLLKLENNAKKCKRVDNISLPSNSIIEKHIYIDYHGGIWLYSYTDEQIFYKKNIKSEWNQINLHSKIETKSNAVRSILDDSNGHVWIGTDHKGVFIYDYVNDNLVNLLNTPMSSTSLASNRINTIYRDDSGVIWLGNFKKGVSYYHESFHEFIDTQHKECGDIASILEDKAGNIWLGTDGNGLYVKEKQKGFAIRKLSIPDIAIISLLEDHKGRIWAGSYQDGLFCYENNSIRHFTPENSQLPYSGVWSMKEDRYGNLWIGYVLETLVCFNPDANTATSYLLPDGNNINVLNICYDYGDKMYIGTTYGLCVMDIVTRKPEMIYANRKETQPFKQLFISTVFKDDRDILWLAHKQGLTAWDLKNDSLHWFDVNNGLCDNLINSITQDNHGNMWLATSNGLSILEVTPDTQEGVDFSFKNLSTRDGLPENHFNSHSACKLSSGDLLLGGTSGYTSINPNKLTEKSRPLAKVYFTNLTIGNQHIEVDSIYEGRKLLTTVLGRTPSLSVRYDDYLISIEFAAGDLLNADKIRYAYKLEGLEENWINIGGDNQVTFRNIPYRNYKLHIKARYKNQEWQTNYSTLFISINPPFWLSWWAKLIYIVSITTIVFFIIKSYKKRLQLRSSLSLEKEKAQKQQELNEERLRFYTNITHELKTPLTLILGPLEDLQCDSRIQKEHLKKISLIHKSTIRLLNLVTQILEFRKTETQNKKLCVIEGNIVEKIQEIGFKYKELNRNADITFDMITDADKIQIYFDQEVISMIVDNLLSNAFKYTYKGTITLALRSVIANDVEYTEIEIADTGIGIPQEDISRIFERYYQTNIRKNMPGFGIGLALVKNLVDLHEGTILVDSEPNVGSSFRVRLITNNSYPDAIHINTNLKESIDEEKSSKPIVLVVEDEGDIRDYIAEALMGAYDVIVAENGEQGCQVAFTSIPDIVISDIMMPVKDGIELCKEIKNNIATSHIPVILLTAKDTLQDKTEGYDAGADSYVTKPFSASLLKSRVANLLEGRKKIASLISSSTHLKQSIIKESLNKIDNEFIERITKIIEENLMDEKIDVPTIAQELSMSYSSLYRKIKALTGMSTGEFIRKLRLRKAEQLLLSGKYNISEIAHQVGLNSVSYFRECFKEEYGMSPSEYIKRLK